MVVTFTAGCKVLGQLMATGFTEGLQISDSWLPAQSFRFSRAKVGPLMCKSRQFQREADAACPRSTP